MSANKEKKKGRFRQVLHVYRKALRLMWKECRGYTVAAVPRWILMNCVPYWEIWFSAKLLDEIFGNRSPVWLTVYAAAMLGGRLVFDYLGYLLYLTEHEGREEFVTTQQMIFARKIMELDYELVEDEPTRQLYRQVVRETFSEHKNLESFRNSLPALLSSLAGLGMSVAMLWEFLAGLREYGLFTVLFAVLAALGVWICGKCDAVQERNWLECNRSISDNINQREGYIGYFNRYARGKEIRIYRLGRLMMDKLMATHRINDRALDRNEARTVPFTVLSGFAEEATTAMTWGLAAFAALTGRITLGGMTKCNQSIIQFIGEIKCIWAILTQLWFEAEYLERYFAFLDIPSQMRKGCLPVEKRADGEYVVAFHHVSFRYPGSDQYALEDIDMSFRVGEKMAVVGMNGSGKSTFIKLLCRLYDPTEGDITLNGIDIRRYDYQEYLNLFSVVFQDFQLFSFTLGENVAVAETYREEAVAGALEKAGMGDFLKEQEKGLSTVLYRDFDEDGVEVSGGEAQKIALARAVYKGAPIVVLDEPTAALDPLAEYEIYRRFNDLVADRTTVYISHRMSSCRFCGDIAVFHEGRIVQRGSHESLMEETGGKYYELWTAQAQYYQKKEGQK